MTDDSQPTEVDGGPVRFGGALICMCRWERTYCPHKQGSCPHWDREPREPSFQPVEDA